MIKLDDLMKKLIQIRKWFAVTACLLFLGLVFLPAGQSNDESNSLVASSNGNTLYVGGSGPSNYTKIQDAIDNSSDDDTVFVYHGVYLENLLIVTSSLSISTVDPLLLLIIITESMFSPIRLILLFILIFSK